MRLQEIQLDPLDRVLRSTCRGSSFRINEVPQMLSTPRGPSMWKESCHFC